MKLSRQCPKCQSLKVGHLERILDLTRHFRVEAGVIVNKADLNGQMAESISETARHMGAEVLGRIPYDKSFTEAQIKGQTLLEYVNSETTQMLESIWAHVTEKILGNGTPKEDTPAQETTARAAEPS